DDAGRTAHVTLHVLHVGSALDGNAAGIEADALADEGHRLIAALTAIPAHDHDPARPCRALGDTEQRPHAKFRHRLDVEDFDVDANLSQWAGAARELFGIENVRRLIHQFARDDHAIDGVRIGRKAFSRG